MAANKGDSRVNLLDAAEALFAEKGFDATSTREIAARSGDTLGTLSYHFASKQKLLEEILRRRFSDVDQLRWSYYRKSIEAADGRVPTVEEIIKSIVYPYLDLTYSGEAGWNNYINLLGRVRESGNPDQQTFFLDFALPYAKTCISWLQAAAPGASQAEVAHAYEFSSMLAILSCSTIARNRLARLSDSSKLEPADHRTHLLKFVNAGASAILRQH